MSQLVQPEQLKGRPSDERRRQRRTNARSLSYALHGIGVAIAIWSWFWPYPYWLVIVTLAALPWIAVVIVVHAHGLLQLARSTRGGGTMSLDTVFAVPALMLGLRAMLDIHLVTWQEALPATAIGGLIIASVATAVDRTIRRRRWHALVAIPLMTCAYSYGLAAEANNLLDRTPPRLFTATVISKHISGGYRSPQRPYFKVSPWGPRQTEEDIGVGWNLFHTVKSGGTVCIALYPGALGVQWYEADTCEQRARSRRTFFQATLD